MPDPPAEPSEPEIPPACGEFQALLGRYFSGGLSEEKDRLFRGHLGECEECRQLYRESLGSAARMGRALRNARTSEQRAERRRDARRRVIAAGMRSSGRGTRFRLQLALLPAGMIILFLWVGFFRGGGKLVIHAPEETRGEVWAAGAELSFEEEPRRLERGDCCSTVGPARVTIEGPGLTVTLDHDTNIIVEDPDEPRLRLIGGQLEVEGPCVLTSPFGVVESDEGRSILVLRSARLEVNCLEGEVSLTGAGGTRRIAGGERAITDPEGIALVTH